MSKPKNTYSGAVLRLAREERERAAADPAEQSRRALAGHERIIENARRSFVAMGQALLAIRTERLYSGEYSTFAEYLEARWDVSEAYANRIISAALVAIKATPIGVEINSEAVARELADLADDAETLRQIWDEATRRAAGGRVTAALVKEVRRSLDPPKPPALEGEVIENKTSPDTAVPEDGEEDAADHGGSAASSEPQDASGLVGGPSLADESGDSHPVTAPPGAAEGVPVPSDADVSTPSATPTDPEAPPASEPVDEPERAGAGVSQPAPAPKREETDEEQKAREDREMREARSLEFATGLVNVRMRLEPDPIRWYQNVYLHGLYHARDLPRVRDSFTPTGIRQAARFLNQLADYLEAAGEEL